MTTWKEKIARDTARVQNLPNFIANQIPPTRTPDPTMNEHERLAWRRLLDMGATTLELGGKPALDIRPIRLRAKDMGRFSSALIEVVGHSGVNRRQTDRNGYPVFVVTDDPYPPQSQGAQHS